MTTHDPKGSRPSSEAGFTLVEALVAIVILVFGLMAVTNLMVVSATSNTVANQSTGAAASASQVLDTLRAADFLALTVGGDLDTDATTAIDCETLAEADGTGVILTGKFSCDSDMPGVGRVHSRWRISTTNSTRLLFIEVRSEGTGALGAGRTRAYFTTFRSCTDSRPRTVGGVACPI
jgi:Tfp pilus assembly protein PilV